MEGGRVVGNPRTPLTHGGLGCRRHRQLRPLSRFPLSGTPIFRLMRTVCISSPLGLAPSSCICGSSWGTGTTDGPSQRPGPLSHSGLARSSPCWAWWSYVPLAAPPGAMQRIQFSLMMDSSKKLLFPSFLEVLEMYS